MARLRKTRSKPLETAEMRHNALINIDENLELGPGFSMQSYNDLITYAQEELNRYNSMIANLDQQRDKIVRLERELNDANERVFKGIILNYGRDSIEYEMVGGVRKSEAHNSSKPHVTHNPGQYLENGEQEDSQGTGES
ncbi:MAG: hypothetical protein WD016_09770 [Balneolaceae bacterium]